MDPTFRQFLRAMLGGVDASHPEPSPDLSWDVGLSSRGVDFVCLRVSRDVEVRGCHEGCLVACGLKEPADA